MSEYLRALHEPVLGRPRWVNPSEGNLRYLSWGWRRYDLHPIPATLHDGWIYQLILSGKATARVQGRTLSMPAGSLIIIDRACPSGWQGTIGIDRCQILSWIWRDQSPLESIRPLKSGFLRITLGPDLIDLIRSNHRKTRNEIVLSDPHFPQAVHALKIQLDILLARSLRQVKSTKNLLKAALAWLHTHPQEMHPASALAEHLQISSATLNRLFRDRLGHGVRQAALEHRMQLARQFLSEGLSVKATAFRLGYSNANDLTRAYSKHWRLPPQQHRKES